MIAVHSMAAAWISSKMLSSKKFGGCAAVGSASPLAGCRLTLQENQPERFTNDRGEGPSVKRTTDPAKVLHVVQDVVRKERTR
jgi:hypothetical protein